MQSYTKLYNKCLFFFSPGYRGNGKGNGGGGGGVLIDGQGPDDLSNYSGEGFGGGGGCCVYDGLSGAVIFDFAPDE